MNDILNLNEARDYLEKIQIANVKIGILLDAERCFGEAWLKNITDPVTPDNKDWDAMAFTHTLVKSIAEYITTELNCEITLPTKVPLESRSLTEIIHIFQMCLVQCNKMLDKMFNNQFKPTAF